MGYIRTIVNDKSEHISNLVAKQKNSSSRPRSRPQQHRQSRPISSYYNNNRSMFNHSLAPRIDQRQTGQIRNFTQFKNMRNSFNQPMQQNQCFFNDPQFNNNLHNYSTLNHQNYNNGINAPYSNVQHRSLLGQPIQYQPSSQLNRPQYNQNRSQTKPSNSFIPTSLTDKNDHVPAIIMEKMVTVPPEIIEKTVPVPAEIIEDRCVSPEIKKLSSTEILRMMSSMRYENSCDCEPVIESYQNNSSGDQDNEIDRLTTNMTYMDISGDLSSSLDESASMLAQRTKKPAALPTLRCDDPVFMIDTPSNSMRLGEKIPQCKLPDAITLNSHILIFITEVSEILILFIIIFKGSVKYCSSVSINELNHSMLFVF